MTKLLTEIQFIAAVPMPSCPRGMERGWLNIVFHAMANTYHLQGRAVADIDEAHLAKLFDSLAAQWLCLRKIARARGVPLDPAEHDPTTVDEMREMFCEAEALNRMFPAEAP